MPKATRPRIASSPIQSERMKFFRFAASTPPPPPPPSRPPAPPLIRSSILKRAPLPRAKPGEATAAPSLVGRWQEPGGNDMTEFRSDGSLVERLGTGETINGRYSLEGLKLSVKLESGDELSFSASITRDALELTDPDGQVARYRRV